MKAKYSYILLAASAVLFFGPFPVFAFLVMPYAETTKDPDAIEFTAWFFGILLMLVGMALFPVALGTWLYERRR